MGFRSLDRRIRMGLGALVLGQALFLTGWGVLYVVALLYVIVMGLPYPALVRSLLARLTVGFVLLVSVVQAAGVVQFFVLPKSGFGTLSLLVTAVIVGLVWALRGKPRLPPELFNGRDVAGVVAVLFFALPLLCLTFWQNDPARLTAFAGVQGADGGNHYTMIAEMAGEQHLDYRDADYYPKGFHLASAFLLHGLHANQQDQTWTANARVYVLMFVGWGAVVAYMALQLTAQLLEALRARLRAHLLLLAVAMGPVLSLLYLFVFAQEGFLSYFYVVAAVLSGVLYLHGAAFQRGAQQWPFVAYLLLSFGVALTWGPLLMPALLAIPVLYAWPHLPSGLRQLSGVLLSRHWRWAALAFVAQVVPLYLHLRYAHLSSQQGLNATGGLKAFHDGIFLAELALTAYAMCSRTLSESWRRFAANVLLPCFLLVGGLVVIQYLTVGELRYYAIKTSLLLEILCLPLAGALLARAFVQSKLGQLQQWLALPLVLGMSAVILSGLTASPFDQARILLGTLSHAEQGPAYVRRYTELGMAERLRGNTVELHYDSSGQLVGNAVVNNWANLMQFTPAGSPASVDCDARIFALQTTPASAEQAKQLVAAVKDCQKAASDHRLPYIVVTDAASVAQLREMLGDATYMY